MVETDWGSATNLPGPREDEYEHFEGRSNLAGREKYNAILRVAVRATAAYTEFPACCESF